MLPVFDTPSGLPQPMINLATGEGIPNSDIPGLVSTAEVSTLQLEFRYLSVLTGNDVYWRSVENVRHYTLQLLVLIILFRSCESLKLHVYLTD